jgi:hypothetical protein
MIIATMKGLVVQYIMFINTNIIKGLALEEEFEIYSTCPTSISLLCRLPEERGHEISLPVGDSLAS